MPKRLEVAGTMFGSWTVIEDADPVYYTKNGKKVPSRAVVVRCDCGTIRSVLLLNLCNQRSRSCGCKRKRVMGQ